MSDLAYQLAQIVGARHVLNSPQPAYEHGARHDRGVALCVVKPADTQQLSQVVACCHTAAIEVVPQSGNTGLVGGSTPDMTGRQVVLSLEKMRGTIIVDKVNRSVVVDAGVRLSELNAMLDRHGLVLPIDLGSDPQVGGMIASNTGGARFIRYGDVRRAVLGLEVVLPDKHGTVLNLLRPLRKNNVGIDLKHLFIGTGGAYGIITKAVFEVQYKPQQTATALIVPRHDSAITDLLMAFEIAAGNCLTAFEGMSADAMHAAFDHVPSLRNPFAGGEVPRYAVLVELTRTNVPRAGEEPIDAMLEGILAELWEANSSPIADAIVGRGDTLWALRHALSEGVKAAGPIVAFDLSFTRGDVVKFLTAARAMLARDFPAARSCDFGHLGDGAVHFNVVWSKQTLSDQGRKALRKAVYALAVEELGGSFSAEHGIGRSNQDIYDHYTPAMIKQLAARLHTVVGGSGSGAIRLGEQSSS